MPKNSSAIEPTRGRQGPVLEQPDVEARVLDAGSRTRRTAASTARPPSSRAEHADAAPTTRRRRPARSRRPAAPGRGWSRARRRSRSCRARGCATRAPGRARRPAPTTVTGTLIRKTEPHQKWVSSRPPSTGPIATPMPTAEVQMPMARDRSPRLEDVGDDGQRLRHDRRAAQAHHRAGRDQLVGRVRVGGEQRAEAEQDQADHQHALAADPVADHPEGEQQAGEDERVGVDRPLELGLAGAEAARRPGWRWS